MLKVGEMIRAKRRELGMTQAELAGKVGVTDGYIAKIEVGNQGASNNTLMKIGDILGIADELFMAKIEPMTKAIRVKFGKPDKEFTKFNYKLQALLLEIAPIIERYL